jgi:hypothetical protein
MSSQGHFWGFKPYSEDMTAAWEVADKFKMTVGYDKARKDWFAFIIGNGWWEDPEFEEHADTAALAICLAALKAMEINVSV